MTPTIKASELNEPLDIFNRHSSENKVKTTIKNLAYHA